MSVTKRKFLGVFPPQTSFDKAHLKAYLKGATNFFHGIQRHKSGVAKRNMDGSIEKYYYKVEQEYTN